ncbi:MAG: PilT/PilU family type 4a pilus ATPase [Candidatus Marinimicrobia bacterium]|nr:PilT/PilU family type 4a pilus ATPase [Candidatus Neomarinimicrobiota bacterium]MCF7830166.1 PilT/PilU family type 4a pilus ATPase [Candidatus Neomarinimicrobiota bacterium]MCF7882100.1 PilT/PilU family type 4a pilus ATPase [Candidatus Neomarinimicrobiota bacterium]
MNLNELIKKMVQKDASDLYITVGAPPMYRIEGGVYAMSPTKLTPEMTKAIAYQFLNEEQKEKFEKENEIDLAYSISGVGRLRLNIYRQRGSIGIVIRHIKSKIQTLDQLGMPSILKELAMAKRGLILVTGATGSGKSTTLAAMIDEQNTNRTCHIVTVEDPLEFLHYHKKSIVTQREVGMDTKSYQRALKSALRQAPDVLLIGEIRDQETMSSALKFAETGHLVLSTLHSVNTNQTMERVMNFFPSEQHKMVQLQLSQNMRGIVSQRLVERKDEDGRIAALEVMLNTPRISDLIYKGEFDKIKETIAAGSQEGLQTFDQSLFKLYQQGDIGYEEALRNADSANDLKLRIKMEAGGDKKSEETDSDENIELAIEDD